MNSVISFPTIFLLNPTSAISLSFWNPAALPGLGSYSICLKSYLLKKYSWVVITTSYFWFICALIIDSLSNTSIGFSLLTLLCFRFFQNAVFFFLFLCLTTVFNSVIAMRQGICWLYWQTKNSQIFAQQERLHVIPNYYRPCTCVYACLALPPNMSFKLLFTMTIHFWTIFPNSNCALIKKKLIFTLDRVGKSISSLTMHAWYVKQKFKSLGRNYSELRVNNGMVNN